MSDTFTYNHNFQDYSVELEVEVNAYRPRHPDVDDVAEIEILSATVTEAVGEYEVGHKFDINLLDYDDVADVYFNQ